MDISRQFWEKTYLENAPKLIGVCRRYVVDPGLAENLVHDAFLKAIDKQSTYKGKGSFEGWLRQIVVNTALMYLRNEKNKKEKKTIELNERIDFAEEGETETNKGIIEEAQFAYNELLAAIDSLPLHHKLVFNFYVFEELSHKQIAQQLNISEGTSKSHLARARKKLKDILFANAASQKKKKTLATLLFPAFVKANPIDSLFRSQMQEFSLPPVKDPNLFLSHINWATTKTPLILKKRLLYVSMQATKFFILPAFITIAAIYTSQTYTYSTKNPAENIQHEYKSEPASNFAPDTVETTIMPVKDSSIIHSTQDSIPNTITKTPVIVKRTTVQKKTIKIKKTIKVYDTTATQAFDTIVPHAHDTTTINQ
ncbi:MAG: sigma-70 family RNA polymerase sigma factor [Prolixibacteraceae bacterium]|nr:sigma-70 family RNA polymerase sigma factor [Prolixibacteraceae bacterium]MBN2650046.1 sigma-70 family RNA polymerase sigma factor [Prolixibacteraceae bacterium]